MRNRVSATLYFSLFAVIASAQTPGAPGRVAKRGPAPPSAFAKDVGELEARYDRASWQSPELILQGLRSDNDDARLKAFQLLGATDDDAHETEYAPNGEASVVATPWKSELLYAPLGEDSSEQAIVAVQVRNLVLVAVATAEGKAWQRIAAFRSLCPSNNTADSYGRNDGGNILASSVEVGRVQEQGFGRAELILHKIDFPSQGDQVLTFDDYTEYEAHYRLQAGQLRRVIAFKSRVRSCEGPRQNEAQSSPPTGPRPLPRFAVPVPSNGMNARNTPLFRPPGSCSTERRWFYHYALENVADAIVVEARGEFPNPGPTNVPFETDLESRYLRPGSCQALKFHEQTHQYEPVLVPSERLAAIPICGSVHHGADVSPAKP